MKRIGIALGVAFLILSSIVILRSVAPAIFPVYYIFMVIGVVLFLVFSHIEFDVLSLFARHLYILSLLFLLIPLLIGQVTRGTVRWIPIGSLTIQPAELVRPFLILFFANHFFASEIDLRGLIKSLILLAIPVVMILLQPSLGVAFLTSVGFFGTLIASGVKKRSVVIALVAMLLAVPIVWLLLAPYQKTRVLTFLNPAQDPSGAGYNSLQSMISVGSGQFWGRGLGQGVQTQLDFLPERHSDFIFASIAEEMGFFGAMFTLVVIGFLLYQVIRVLNYSVSPQARIFVAGVFLVLFTQVVIHVGMNMGMLPITGVPLPLVSAGGSSFIATMIMLGMVVSARKK